MSDTDKYEEYQNARVEGFIPAEWEFEDYLLAEVKRLRERLRDATDLLHDCEYYICPTCNQWADRNYNCDNCEVIE